MFNPQESLMQSIIIQGEQIPQSLGGKLAFSTQVYNDCKKCGFSFLIVIWVTIKRRLWWEFMQLLHFQQYIYKRFTMVISCYWVDDFGNNSDNKWDLFFQNSVMSNMSDTSSVICKKRDSIFTFIILLRKVGNNN